VTVGCEDANIDEYVMSISMRIFDVDLCISKSPQCLRHHEMTIFVFSYTNSSPFSLLRESKCFGD
jgi:hypothetical protein